MAIKILTYETGGAPKMLSSVDEINAAIGSGNILPDTRVTLYLTDDTNCNDRADAHPELAHYFAGEEEENPPIAQTAGKKEPKQSVWEDAFQRAAEASPSTDVRKPPCDGEKAESLPDRSVTASQSDMQISPDSSGLNKGAFRASGNGKDEPDNFFGWMVRPYRLYANFQGRASRTEYWAFSLLVFIVLVVALFSESPTLFTLFLLGTVCPGLAVTVRRLHDAGLSGWLVLIAIIPYLGSLVLLVLTLLESKKEPNQYGPVPGGL